MDLQQRQIRERNRTGFITATVIAAAILGITLLEFVNGFDIRMVIRLVASIAVLVVIAAGYGKMKDMEAYKHVCGCSMIVLYIATLFTAMVGGMYAIVYAIAILVMIFGDKQLTRIGAAAAVVFLLICQILLVKQGINSVSEAVIDVVFTVIACALIMVVVNTQNRHSEESIRAVKAGMEAQVQTSDDIVRLARQLNQEFMQAKETADTLNETMNTTHVSVTEIADSSKMTAEAIEQQTGQTADIQQSIQEVGNQARNIGEISDRTNTTVDEGVELIGRLRAQAAEVAKINIETRATTQALNESIKDVQAITETILGISSQTNLLALNASIEAARAGAAGKGFAVVAEEIRTLSESTRQATEQISDIIERLTKDAQSAAESMTQSANYAQKQNELIEETGGKLNDIKVETDELHEGVILVNGSVQNIIDANTRIMDSITNLSATSEEVAASTDTVLSISDSSMTALGDMNRTLKGIGEISGQLENVARKQGEEYGTN